jgi:hypothetical protein
VYEEVTENRMAVAGWESETEWCCGVGIMVVYTLIQFGIQQKEGLYAVCDPIF